jgi:hypothetical protein
VCVLSHWFQTTMNLRSDLPAVKCSSHWSLGLYPAAVEVRDCYRTLAPRNTRRCDCASLCSCALPYVRRCHQPCPTPPSRSHKRTPTMTREATQTILSALHPRRIAGEGSYTRSLEAANRRWKGTDVCHRTPHSNSALHRSSCKTIGRHLCVDVDDGVGDHDQHDDRSCERVSVGCRI